MLAHELTHVVQQSNNRAINKQRSIAKKEATDHLDFHEIRHIDTHIQRAAAPTIEGSRETVRAKWSFERLTYLIKDDIQWHLNGLLGQLGVDLILFFETKEKRHKYSEAQIGEISVAVLATSTGLKFKSGKRAELVGTIAKDMARIQRNSIAAHVHIEYHSWIDLFEEKSWSTYLSQLKANLGVKLLPPNQLFASGNFSGSAKSMTEGKRKATGADTDTKRTQLKWAIEQQKKINDLIEKAHKQKPRPQDLPDRLVVWYNKHNNSWYLNVWVHFDTQGKVKVHYPVRLKPEESIEQLFKRVRTATSKALQRFEDKQQRQREEDMPRWAQDLKRNLNRRLKELQRKEKTTNFPDGLTLVIEKRGEKQSKSAQIPTETSKQKTGPYILFRIWVERPSSKGAERNYGIVPWPLTPQTTVEQLVPLVRHTAAILRQFEKTPPGKQPPPPEGVKITPPGTEQPLRAFPAKIIPTDLRPDKITVTGANNEFRMRLDYEKVYGGGKLKTLYIASKLYQQYIHFFWKIYKLPDDFQPVKGQGEKITPWHKRWKQLYDLFNQTSSNQEKSSEKQPIPPKLEKIVDSRNTSDTKTRVK